MGKLWRGNTILCNIAFTTIWQHRDVIYLEKGSVMGCIRYSNERGSLILFLLFEIDTRSILCSLLSLLCIALQSWGPCLICRHVDKGLTRIWPLWGSYFQKAPVRWGLVEVRAPQSPVPIDERRRRAKRTDAQRIEDKKKERDCHAELTDEERLIQKNKRRKYDENYHARESSHIE